MASRDRAWGAAALTVRLGGRVVLDRVTVDIPRGEITAVVGGDGAGKTSLLGALAGRIPIASGTVTMPAKDEIGFQPSTAGVWRDLTVDENIEFVGSAYRMSPDLLGDRKARLLGPAGLGGVGDRLGGQLSGGMRHKLGFCMAMLHRPLVLLLDEPSTGVDPVSRVELWRMVAEAAAAGTAVLMSTTYLDEAERAHRVLVLDGGEILGLGTPDEMIASIPGTISTERNRPLGEAANRTWRRGSMFRVWSPSGRGRCDEHTDLEDAVIALMLARNEQRNSEHV
ncbi:ABC transporter ATP-binding protein [Rhodococcus opacus]|uniref:ABC transporter ATP-binding protein n=1 Tax=Rhodococcus sp. IEGM 1351 TaxID=3047089 RepID=UPI0003098E74|nr:MULTISPECIES: ABC transporter ATP-binding protein [Rhodococcus]MDV6241331.1 ABC transporter ATP-binding protein [Rhodococcus opacus]UNN03504.1 ABC transporter ATP-binding protein [Rhodococcus opacus]WKN57481.1 ABC transporter ATP-binding protein [Rhodococcus opacus]CAG7598788.1 putative multidrug ABC transporter ATP-binding protein YbhF [Rhodococcus opacus]